MSTAPNRPRPEPPRQGSQGNLSWIVFLLILARPLWGILRSLVGPQISNTQLWLVVGGALALVALALLAPRGLRRDTPAGRLPTGQPPARLPAPPRRAIPDAALRPPRFEPIITRNVVLAGGLLLGLMSFVFLLVLLA